MIRMIRSLNFAIVIALAMVSGAAASEPLVRNTPDTAVVCAPTLRKSMDRWLTHRRGQGHEVVWFSNQGTAAEIQSRLREHYDRTPFRYLVLVGDAPDEEAVSGLATPTHLVEAKVNVKWGSERFIAADAPYADVDQDGLPDVAVGRIPADSHDELAQMLDRVIRYETHADHGPWRTRVNLVAGVGGFGSLADYAIEATTKTFLTECVPSCYLTSMTYGSWRSAFCPAPHDFHRTTLRRLNEGCLFWVYIGHGQRTYLDYVRVPGRAYGILSTQDAEKLNAQETPPIAIFLSCYAGAFDARRDCLAEVLMKQPGGPIATYAGSRVTMPYAMAVMSHSLLQNYFVHRKATLGELVLQAKRELVEEVQGDAASHRRRELLNRLAAAISPSPKLLVAERREHIALFNLLGDPLLRLPHPQRTQVQAPEEVRAGDEFDVRIEGPPGKAIVEFVCRRDYTRRSAPQRTSFDATPRNMAQYNDTYEMANDPVWMRVVADLNDGPRTLRLRAPGDARGHCFVRVHVVGQEGFGAGAAPVYVRPPTAGEEP